MAQYVDSRGLRLGVLRRDVYALCSCVQGKTPELGNILPDIYFQVGAVNLKFNNSATVVWGIADSLTFNRQGVLPTNIYASAICVKDSLLLYAGAGKSLVVRNIDSENELGRLVGHDQQVTAVAARGNLAISAQFNGSPRLWNLQTLQCTATLPDMRICRSTYCMEGKVLLGSAAGTIQLWDVAASAPVPLPGLEGHTDLTYCIKASSASTVLSGSVDKTVRLWDLRTCKCVRTMEGHTESVISVDMDGQSCTAVSGSKDTTVKLWDLGSGRCSATLKGHTSRVRDVVMHESGRSFMSSGFTDLKVNTWAVGNDKPSMRADLKPFSLPDNNGSRLFASRDLSTVVYCCFGATNIEFRLWR